MKFLSFNERRLPHEMQLFQPSALELSADQDKLNRFVGSMVGLAVGDAQGGNSRLQDFKRSQETSRDFIGLQKISRDFKRLRGTSSDFKRL